MVEDLDWGFAEWPIYVTTMFLGGISWSYYTPIGSNAYCPPLKMIRPDLFFLSTTNISPSSKQFNFLFSCQKLFLF
jgi:hypothetical protein